MEVVHTRAQAAMHSTAPPQSGLPCVPLGRRVLHTEKKERETGKYGSEGCYLSERLHSTKSGNN